MNTAAPIAAEVAVIGPVEVGQTIAAEIEGLGRLENHVIAEPVA